MRRFYPLSLLRSLPRVGSVLWFGPVLGLGSVLGCGVADPVLDAGPLDGAAFDGGAFDGGVPLDASVAALDGALDAGVLGPLDADGTFPPPPNDLDPGDGTRATGGTIVYDGRTGNTPASQTGCRAGVFPNQWNVVVESFGGGFGLTFAYVMVSLPLDRLTASRVFDVAPAPTTSSWVGLDQASILFTMNGEPIQLGQGGSVWVQVVGDVVEVRFEAVPLVLADGTSSGNTLSLAYRCWDPLP